MAGGRVGGVLTPGHHVLVHVWGGGGDLTSITGSIRDPHFGLYPIITSSQGKLAWQVGGSVSYAFAKC